MNCVGIIALQHAKANSTFQKNIKNAIIESCFAMQAPRAKCFAPFPGPLVLATEQELSDFLKSVEKRAFKRSLYHVRNEEAALDIVQDSMLKLSEHYGDKPASELPMLFQRILSNCTLDWFRRQKTRNALFSNMSDFEGPDEDGMDFDLLEAYSNPDGAEGSASAEDETTRAQTFREIEAEIKELPARQREAFLMRYWEEMDVAETAAAMGCSEGSVKTHCFRAIQTLSKALKAKGIEL
ncbi:RNA polymerase sigma factor [Acidovorax sp. DW039]|nr:RNA polymerase sigma factor [Acidovorax sp. DW039]